MSPDRLEELKEQIAALQKRWPAHSVPPALMEQLDELEEALNRELERSSDMGVGMEGSPQEPRRHADAAAQSALQIRSTLSDHLNAPRVEG